MTGPSRAEHLAEVEDWRRRRYANLRRDVGWLTLAGLDWLAPGVNRLGTDPAVEVVLPSGPPIAGSLTVDHGVVVADGDFVNDDEPVTGLPLTTDRDGTPTLLKLGALRLCVIDRGGRLAVRTWDTASERLRDFKGIDHWPVDLAWRLDAGFEPTPGRELTVPDFSGESEATESPGDVVLAIGGENYRLQALPGGDAGGLWLIFGDATNGQETYAGGRYLYTPAPAGGSVVVDFNLAYNPPCVFTPYATCTLPWPENRLPVSVTAGELIWPEADGATHHS